MKKIVLFIAAVCAFTLTNAQEKKNIGGLDVIFGAKAGLNISTLLGDVSDSSPFVGVHFGAMAEATINEKFAAQPEILFSMQGSSDIKLNYLLFPIIGKYYVMENLSLEAGPSLGILLSTNVNGVNYRRSGSSTDIGFNIGAGYKLNDKLNFGLRYSIGLTDVYYSGTNNSVLQLSAGYFFM